MNNIFKNHKLLSQLDTVEKALLIAVAKNEYEPDYEDTSYTAFVKNVAQSVSPKEKAQYNFLVSLVSQIHEDWNHDLYDLYLRIQIVSHKVSLANISTQFHSGPARFDSKVEPYFEAITEELNQIWSEVITYQQALENIERMYFSASDIIGRNKWFFTPCKKEIEDIVASQIEFVTQLYDAAEKAGHEEDFEERFYISVDLDSAEVISKMHQELLSRTIVRASVSAGFFPSYYPEFMGKDTILSALN